MLEALPLLPGLKQALLPLPDQTLLLRACLQPAEEARAAWLAWRGTDPRLRQRLADGRRGARRYLPLLYRAVKRHHLTAEAGLLTYLRTATMYEGLRTRAYRRVSRLALASLQARGVPVLVLKGPALAATAYERWSLRHSHDLDLLIAAADLPRAAAALEAAEFRRVGRAPDLVLRHPSGMPAALHFGLFEIPYYRPDLARVWAASREISVAGQAARILDLPDLLVHVGGHAACSRSREMLQWVCDSWGLIERHPDLDWDAVEARIHESRLALPLAVMFDYLHSELGVPIPPDTLGRLKEAAARSEPAARDAALAGARTGTRGTLSDLLRATPGLGGRLRLLWWAAFPSAEFVRRTQSVDGRGQLLRFYFARGWNYVSRRLGGRFKRRAG